ncbi:hypothetical protein ECG_02892 [Echinococcus granulosus]|uniref:Expressed protein n=1 Tax=Echinococcus granulosus TaxID=6210 RepID=A0A068WJ68_ECHGR|nr:hypothetical protein ECG_02892 [Echinococcus granulosus]CDS20145.1 expressed protein [Echinococcus granulosus]
MILKILIPLQSCPSHILCLRSPSRAETRLIHQNKRAGSNVNNNSGKVGENMRDAKNKCNVGIRGEEHSVQSKR